MLNLLIALALAPADAPPQPVPTSIYRRKPTATEVERLYPRKARAAGVSGRVMISCRINGYGRLIGCTAVEESPEGWGFGNAAVKLAPLWRFSPSRTDGSTVEGVTLRLPIEFRP